MPLSATQLKKWKLLSKEDVSPSSHLPVEKRVYELPDGSTIDDFYVATIPDSVHVVPVTSEGTVVMVRMYKQGADDFIIQFPAGRFEVDKHGTREKAAVAELAEETGIHVSEEDLIKLGAFPIMTTKGTEKFITYLVSDIELAESGAQNLDPNEEIEILELTPDEIDELICTDGIVDTTAITNWAVVRLKHPELF
ncbi:MAG: NUDIX hydrolase [Candidatus Pacebacteria bacterium]|nr:NUDIX hydrolase [Candidatus Paceibacterota bacterium]PIR63363.1 MAG: hypothetical protein COU64_04780 [Candidatus Pacebacteria bacterium CG10_big_fil_rev_8_21_14_0_10_40_26]PIZ79111.1 MAG: hypothetical protein COY01_01650 [Candidatus Pacebacteria bacterium CG_4_10_14_0_2_um_filter_40_20]PJA69201.1 MAG: hypothetical protein CO156_01185 [Candidatus Pacebacteria bacterium CG_4_9_14_3_um_filter_40_12]PJC42077.1 MAG: hypothetical protein CO041_00360 [Candidatus Pacebacteria bacterium CG_4_9_14_0_